MTTTKTPVAQEQLDPTEHRFTVIISGCTPEQAQKVMQERLGFDEDYGFAYTLDWM